MLNFYSEGPVSVICVKLIFPKHVADYLSTLKHF